MVIAPLCWSNQGDPDVYCRRFYKGDVALLQKWAKAGGNLLVMTDKTRGVRGSENAVITPVAGIKINDDSVEDSRTPGRTRAITAHPITNGVSVVAYGAPSPSLSVLPDSNGQIVVTGSQDAYSRYFTHSPPVVVASEGVGKVVVVSSEHGIKCFFGNRCIGVGDNQILALNILRWFLEKGGGQSSKPSQITDRHIARMQDIQDQVQAGTWTQEDAKAGFGALAAEVGKDGLTWLLKRMPVYDSQTEKYVTLDNFAKDLAGSGSTSGAQPRAQEDPVGTAVELLFGDSSPENIRKLFGVDK